MKKLLLVFTLAGIASAQVPDSVMKVLSTFRDSAGNITTRIQNTGSKTITAWEMNFPGADVNSMALWAEWQHFEPGEIKDGPGSWHLDVYDGTKPEILGVVFEDGTAIGYKKTLDEIFARRQGIADEFARWNSVSSDWTRERFSAEIKRAWPREKNETLMIHSAYEMGVSIAADEIRATLERPEVRTMSDVREFLGKRAHDSQIATRRAK